MRIGTVQIEKRQIVPPGIRILNSVLFALLALVFSSLLIIAAGFNPIAVYAKMISYSFMSLRGLNGSIKAGLPLMLCGLSVSVAFRMNLNNIGAEGQYAAGALLGGWFALFGPDMPAAAKLIVMFLLCAAGGALLAAIAAVLKAYWNVNETIVTLMLNYIALLFMDYLCYGPWMAPKQTSAITEQIPKDMFLPNIGNTGINSAIIIAVVMALCLYLFSRYTTAGYEIDVIRNSVKSAEYAGINVKRKIIAVMIISGAIAGLAGFVQITGIVHRVQAQLPGGNGYTGIVVAYLSRFNPIAVIIVSILFGGLKNSCAAVQIMGVPSQIATMLQGSIMIFVIAGEFLNYFKLTLNREKHGPGRLQDRSDMPGLKEGCKGKENYTEMKGASR